MGDAVDQLARVRGKAHSPPQREQLLGQFQLGPVIGKGSFGTVHKGINITNGEVVAIKKFKCAKISKENLAGIMAEADLLKALKHPHIVKFRGYIKTREYLYFVLEYMEEGSLVNMLKEFGLFPESLVGLYVSQLLEGLAYLHQRKVIHRDIKAANILLAKNGICKLADFGVAAQLNENDKRFSVVGTPYWMAPEVIEVSGHTIASDIWSVGCLIIELLTGSPPYFSLEPVSAMFRIVRDDHPPFPPNISKELESFLTDCFQKDPEQRPSAEQLLRHPWLEACRTQSPKFAMPSVDEVKQRLRADRPQAISGAELLSKLDEKLNACMKRPAGSPASASPAVSESDTEAVSPAPANHAAASDTEEEPDDEYKTGTMYHAANGKDTPSSLSSSGELPVHLQPIELVVSPPSSQASSAVPTPTVTPPSSADSSRSNTVDHRLQDPSAGAAGAPSDLIAQLRKRVEALEEELARVSAQRDELRIALAETRTAKTEAIALAISYFNNSSHKEVGEIVRKRLTEMLDEDKSLRAREREKGAKEIAKVEAMSLDTGTEDSTSGTPELSTSPRVGLRTGSNEKDKSTHKDRKAASAAAKQKKREEKEREKLEKKEKKASKKSMKERLQLFNPAGTL